MPNVNIGENTGDDFSGFEDTALRSSEATSNYEAESALWYAPTDDVILFRCSGLSSISSATITSTSIYFWTQIVNVGACTPDIKRSLRNWVVTQATWNIYSTGNNWQTAGGTGAADLSATISSTGTWDADEGEYKSFPTSAQLVTDTQNFIDSVWTNNGYLAVGDCYNYLTMSEGNDGNRPYQSVTYTPVSGGSVVVQLAQNLYGRRRRISGD